MGEAPNTPQIASLPNQRGRIGLMAGWGSYPLIVAQALRRSGFETYCLGVAGHADAALAELCDDFHWIGLAKVGRAIRYFKSHGVTEAIMAGKIHKILLFQPWAWVRYLPDLRTLRAMAPYLVTRKKDCKDDSLMGMLVNEFAADGIRFRPATDFAPELLVKPGRLSSRGPSGWQWKDIRFGWQMAKEMGRLDVGQSVAVKDQAALAVEAVEGTDACIARAGGLCRAGGFTVVKVAKPQQDMRFDVPTVGVGTLETLYKAGGRVLAIEAGRTIVLDQPAVVDFANRHKLILVALEEADLAEQSAETGPSFGR
jgi:UDP-2,3-diacylglucosamine hydrolase